MLGNNIFDEDVATHGRGRGHVGARPPIWSGNDGIRAAAEALHAAHLDDVGARAGDLRAHRVQEVREIDDMRLLRAVFNDGHPAAQHRREQNVHRRADGDDVEIDVPPPSPSVGASAQT